MSSAAPVRVLVGATPPAYRRTLALLGPNGAGKTTLVRILSTLLEPDAGSARIAGFDVIEQPTAVRRGIGLAGQCAAVDETLTGRENLDTVGRLSRRSKSLAAEPATEVLERVSLTDAADRPLKTLRGEEDRRALVDEGTSRKPTSSRATSWSSITARASLGRALHGALRAHVVPLVRGHHHSVRATRHLPVPTP
jgi:ABC-2 type transport system ATP-binding protein